MVKEQELLSEVRNYADQNLGSGVVEGGSAGADWSIVGQEQVPPPPAPDGEFFRVLITLRKCYRDNIMSYKIFLYILEYSCICTL